MRFTIDQIKALLRATSLEKRLDMLTGITLGVDDEQIIRFCESYRWILAAKDNKNTMAGDKRIQAFIDSAIKEESFEIHIEEGG